MNSKINKIIIIIIICMAIHITSIVDYEQYKNMFFISYWLIVIYVWTARGSQPSFYIYGRWVAKYYGTDIYDAHKDSY